MFDEVTGTFLDLSHKSLMHLYRSLNQAQVSPGVGLTAQVASAYIFVFRNSPKEVEIMVGLHFTESGQRVLYKVPPFAPENTNEKVLDAEAFVGEMGFMMDNVRLSSLGPDERSELLRKIPFFYKDMRLFRESFTESELETQRAKAEATGQKDAQVEMHRLFYEQYITLLSML